MEKYIEIIKQLADKRGESINKVLTGCGINLSAYDTWKKGIAKPSMQTLIKLADYFEITIDYLIGRETNSDYISKDEKWLVDSYRRMDSDNKEEFEFYASYVLEKQEQMTDDERRQYIEWKKKQAEKGGKK